MLPARQKSLFALFTFALFLLLIVLLEFALRLTMPSLSSPLLKSARYDGIEWREIQRGYPRQYFSTSDPLIPEFKQTLIRKEKTPRTFRILALGESTMFGVPYQMTCNIPGLLRKQLRHLYPDREIEVVNLAASAINSNAVEDLAGQSLQLQPDLVILYLGHNEFYGPDGISATRLERIFPQLIQLKYWFRATRIGSLIRKELRSVPAPRTDRDLNLMRQVSRESHVRLNTAPASEVLARFRANLASIIGTFRAAHIPIIISDVTSNLQFPPFASDLNRADSLALIRVDSLDAGGEHIAAADLLQRELKADSTAALLHFRLGEEDQILRRFPQAKEEFVRAKDLDLLKFRAPEETNRIIREVCRSLSVPMISSDSLFCAASTDGIPGSDLFWEHLHPRPYGYYLIANLFLREILDLHFLGNDDPDILFARRLPFQYDSLSICWLDLAFGDLSMRHLTSRWPFEHWHVDPIAMTVTDDSLKQIAINTYGAGLVWDLACYETAERFLHIGAWREAETTYEALLEEYPDNFYSHYLLGRLFNAEGKYSLATPHYRRSIQSNPTYLYPRLDLGLIEINEGKLDVAIEELQTALSLAPTVNTPMITANIYYGLAAAFANKRDFAKASEYLAEALKVAPGYRDALQLQVLIDQLRRTR